MTLKELYDSMDKVLWGQEKITVRQMKPDGLYYKGNTFQETFEMIPDKVFDSEVELEESGFEQDGTYTIVLKADDSSKDNQEFNPISNPSHYTEGREYEPRKVIIDWDLNYYLGNAVKYIARAGRKGDAIEDLKKARQYLDWEIERRS